MFHFERAIYFMNLIFESQKYLETKEQVSDFIKNLEVPCCMRLAECFQQIAKPDLVASAKYCTQIIEKNLGICMDDPQNELEVMRCQAFYLRAKAYLGVANYLLAEKDF